MHFQGLVFGDHPQDVMNSLIQTSGEPPAEVWTPLDVEDQQARSGWHTVSSEHTQDVRSTVYGPWLRCVWPTRFLREHLGPHALLPDSALASLELPTRVVEKKDGGWRARIPRFFTTIGVFWSMTYDSPRWQSRGSFDAGGDATVGSLDLEHNLAMHEPNLVVGPDGPVFYDGPQEVSQDGRGRRLAAAEQLMDLPSATPVTLVSWHDTAPVATTDWFSEEVEERCPCVRPRRPYHWDPPYDESLS